MQTHQPHQTPSIASLLEKVVELGGSDLSIKAGSRPAVRVEGKLRWLDETASELRVADTRALLYEILPESRIAEFEREHEADFAYTVADAGTRALSRQRIPSARQRFDRLPPRPRQHPLARRARAAGRCPPTRRGGARDRPDHGIERRRQVDDARGDDRAHQSRHASSTSSRSRTRSSSCTATSARSSSSVRSAPTLRRSKARCAACCARTRT